VSGAREQILARVRAALADVSADEPAVAAEGEYRVESELGEAELAQLFTERAADYTASVRRAATGAVADAVAAALAAHRAQRIVVAPGISSDWLPAGIDFVEDGPGLGVTELDRAEGALTGCALAIAETGTIVLDAGLGQGRRALTLVPDLHVCVVETGRIVGTVPEAVRALEGRVSEDRRPLTFLSGPSATSDIELERVEGVHGPRRLELVVA
jgi:L-lactate dehydrogenase complex protein LldG